MFKKLVLTTLLLGSFGASFLVSASLMLETYSSGTATPTTIGGYTMTDFGFSNNTGLTSSINSPLGGTVDFIDKYGNSADMTQSSADSQDWWINGELTDYDIYTTDKHLITLVLPEDTLAFSFNIGADLSGTGNNAWLTAMEVNGSGIDSKYWFNVNDSNTPGFGIYADNTGGNCSSISSVTIDPLLWGFGNFSISRGDCSTNIPEPSSLLLMSAGFIGLMGSLLTRRKRKFI